MISLELSTIQQKNADRDRIAAAMTEFETRAVVHVLPTVVRVIDLDTEFNSRTQAGTYTLVQQSRDARDARIIEAAKTMSVSRAAQELGMHHSTLGSAARRLGVEFQRAYSGSALHKTHDARDVERIKALQQVGLNRGQVMQQTGMSYEKFHRLLTEYAIDFPKGRRHKPKPAACAG